VSSGWPVTGSSSGSIGILGKRFATSCLDDVRSSLISRSNNRYRRLMRPSGAFRKLFLAAPGCLYGFHGGGLPSHVHTIAVIPFDNQTPVADIQREISDSLRVRLISRLGLREASEARASAVVRGTIRR